MSSLTDKLDRVIDRYLAGGLPYGEFDAEFMDLYLDESLSDEEALRYEPAYDLVYMGAEGEIPPADQAVGVIGEAELKAQLRVFRDRTQVGPT